MTRAILRFVIYLVNVVLLDDQVFYRPESTIHLLAKFGRHDVFQLLYVW